MGNGWMTISKRKSEHVRVVLEKDVRFRNKTSGFEDYAFVHCALPEMNLEDVTTEVAFLGRRLSFPLMVSGMTGGYAGALEINRRLAEVCQAELVGMGVGSQRQMMENDAYLESFRVVRKTAPDIPVVGNIGAVQVAEMKDFCRVQRMVATIEADGLAVHLNPLQEVLQPEGEARFSGVLKGIERLVQVIGVPVVVKEVGCGISEDVARKLVGVGVAYVDVAGAGGTSWAGIESYRGAEAFLTEVFWDWGIPTAQSLEMVSRVEGVRVIASGGINNGMAMAKALALGAELCGAARPLLRSLMRNDEKANGLVSVLNEWRKTLKTVMFLTGSRCVQDLCRDGILEKRVR